MLAIGLAGLLCACTVVSPDPGQQAVLVDKPLFFGKGGIRLDDVRDPGRTYTWLTTSATYVDVTPQTVQVAFDDFSSSDNILLDFSTQIQYRITAPALLLSRFGQDWFKNNVASQYASIVRDQVKRYDMTKMMSDPDTARKIDDSVTQNVSALVRSKACRSDPEHHPGPRTPESGRVATDESDCRAATAGQDPGGGDHRRTAARAGAGGQGRRR